MKDILLKCVILFIVFFTGAAGILMLDDICKERTGEGGNLVFDIDNMNDFK